MIYYVEDDDNIRDLTVYALRKQGIEAEGFSCDGEFKAAVARRVPDAVLLDIMLPDTDGLAIMRRLRADRLTATVPIMMLTAKDTELDKVMALDLGADDYIEKPFGTSELLARIRTAIRHTRTPLDNNEIAQSGKFTVKDLTIDYDKHHVLIGDQDVHLTLNEFKIVALLGKYAGKVLTYDHLIKQIWGPKARADNQILRANMANIRRKIEKNPASPEYIFTEIGVGYRMLENDA